MKTIIKPLAIVLFVVFSFSVVIAGATDVTSFSDVPAEHWAYKTVMPMVNDGLFMGTTTPVDGVGTFSPEKTMTRAEFITVTMRVLDPERSGKVMQGNAAWWMGYYMLAIDHEILSVKELDSGNMDAPITREEMAMVMVRCVEKQGDSLKNRISESQIPDIETVGTYYKNYVMDCYSYGLLCGVDDKGTFAPKKTLTRAEAATVLWRLKDKDSRIKVSFDMEEPENKEEEKPTGSTGGGGTRPSPGNKDEEKPTEPEKDENLWADKIPAEYTWEEFQALSEEEQENFFNWFDTPEAFEEWMIGAQPENPDAGNIPWENGGKLPTEYTWEEFQSLDEYTQESFFNWFDSPEAFEAWMNKAQAEDNEESTNPWENGGKLPTEYTWEEFQALDEYAQENFFNWFETPEAFEEWMHAVGQ